MTELVKHIPFHIYDYFIKPYIKRLYLKDKLNLLHLIKKLICYNQGRYIEFEFLLGENHKNLRQSLEQKKNIDDIKSNYENLKKYSTLKLRDFLNDNINDYILEYFKCQDRSEILPRVCIKMINQNNYIVDWIRSDPQFFTKHQPPFNSNTGFKYVIETGRYYKELDIPKAALKGFYINPRLKIDKIKNYRTSLRNHIIKDEPDQKWCDCWTYSDNLTEDDLHRSSYKSTIILPMTLINNRLGDTFKNKFFPPGKERTIWGFLCIDHPTIKYFDIAQDVPFGYICADILSLYCISAYIHIGRSKTFNEASKILESK